ncbi:MAG: nuclear transport factor 2 family protein [Alphaproteobacteria bacterium]|nr:nuclear transport factor 2 family protein [Alphaproteobacteria bacterium]
MGSATGIEDDDRVELLDLLSRYNHLFDSGQAEAWADCFAPDGSFDGPAGTAHGRDELAEFCRSVSPKIAGSLHITDHHLFEVENGVVSHKCVLAVHFPTDEGVRTQLFRYADEFEKSDGVWRFASRRVLPA